MKMKRTKLAICFKCNNKIKAARQTHHSNTCVNSKWKWPQDSIKMKLPNSCSVDKCKAPNTCPYPWMATSSSMRQATWRNSKTILWHKTAWLQDVRWARPICLLWQVWIIISTFFRLLQARVVSNFMHMTNRLPFCYSKIMCSSLLDWIRWSSFGIVLAEL